MYVRKCGYCGTEITAQYKSKLNLFCSRSCHAKFKKSGLSLVDERNLPIASNGQFICPHNCEVTCKERKCSRCGWNPAVARGRLNHIAVGLVERCANV